MTNKKNKLTVGQIIQIASYTLLFPAAILFLAGDWFWIEGWIFSVWFLVMCYAIGAYLFRNDPALLPSPLLKIEKASVKKSLYFLIWLCWQIASRFIILPAV